MSTTTVTLTAEHVRAAVSVSEAIDAVRQAFLDLEAGAFEQPTRIALRDGQFLVMSAHHKETASAMVKTLSLISNGRPQSAELSCGRKQTTRTMWSPTPSA